jgi:hypothetical protein
LRKSFVGKENQMLKRRSLILGAPAAIFATQVRGQSRDVGRSVGPALLSAVNSLPGVIEGHGRGTLTILFAPWCHVSPTLYGTTRGFLNEISLRWVPFSGGQLEGRLGTERILASGTAGSLARNFIPAGTQPDVSQPTPLSDAQDHRMEQVERIAVSETGQPLSTPTLLFVRFDGRYRAILGGVDAFDLRKIADVIA